MSTIAEEHKALVAPFEPSRLSSIQIEGRAIGYIGEFNHSVIKALKLPDFVAGFELSLSSLVGLTSTKAEYRKMSKYPSVEQDICFKVDMGVSYEAIIDLVFSEFSKASDGVELDRVNLLDIFQRPEDLGHKQITLRLSVINHQRTMTDAEVNVLLDKLAVVAKDKLNAERI
jgi:phenylalanyl-tRNA synthetase beta subunit